MAALLALGLGAGPARADCSPPPEGASTVELATAAGSICIDLRTGPATSEAVSNFVGLVESGEFDDSFFHRSAENMNEENVALFGGLFRHTAEAGFVQIQEGIRHEDTSPESNLRGTVSMWRIGETNTPSQFIINMKNNSHLDEQGLTVFGEVQEESLSVIDDIADLPVVNGTTWLTSPLRIFWINLPLYEDVVADTYGCFDPLDGGVLGTREDLVLDEFDFPIIASPACQGEGSDTGCTAPPTEVEGVFLSNIHYNPSEGGLVIPYKDEVHTLTCEEVAASDEGRMQLEDAVESELVKIQEATVVPEPASTATGAAGLGVLALLRGRRRLGS